MLFLFTDDRNFVVYFYQQKHVESDFSARHSMCKNLNIFRRRKERENIDSMLSFFFMFVMKVILLRSNVLKKYAKSLPRSWNGSESSN